jgi:hypothetical protein
MPRKPQPKLVPPPADLVETKPLALSPSARQLVAEIERDWELSPATRSLLRAAAESLTQAELFDELAARDGHVCRDAKGSMKASPSALLGRDHRAAFTSTMQRLLAHLEK